MLTFGLVRETWTEIRRPAKEPDFAMPDADLMSTLVATAHPSERAALEQMDRAARYLETIGTQTHVRGA